MMGATSMLPLLTPATTLASTSGIAAMFALAIGLMMLTHALYGMTKIVFGSYMHHGPSMGTVLFELIISAPLIAFGSVPLSKIANGDPAASGTATPASHPTHTTTAAPTTSAPSKPFPTHELLVVLAWIGIVVLVGLIALAIWAIVSRQRRARAARAAQQAAFAARRTKVLAGVDAVRDEYARYMFSDPLYALPGQNGRVLTAGDMDQMLDMGALFDISNPVNQKFQTSWAKVKMADEIVREHPDDEASLDRLASALVESRSDWDQAVKRARKIGERKVDNDPDARRARKLLAQARELETQLGTGDDRIEERYANIMAHAAQLLNQVLGTVLPETARKAVERSMGQLALTDGR